MKKIFGIVKPSARTTTPRTQPAALFCHNSTPSESETLEDKLERIHREWEEKMALCANDKEAVEREMNLILSQLKADMESYASEAVKVDLFNQVIESIKKACKEAEEADENNK